MRAFYILPALALLGACTVAPVTGSDPTGGRSFCGSPSDPICRFLNAPVALLNQRVELPKRAYPFFPIREPLQFIEAQEKYGASAWTPHVIKSLEEATGVELRAEGFPDVIP